MNPDGISYLDIGTLYASHRWSEAINAYWSPLYSWLVGIVLAFEPAARWEFPLVHVVNFLIFLGALASFEWLVSTLLRRDAVAARDADSPSGGRTCTSLVVFAYGTFAWSTLSLVSLTLVNPDLLLYSIVFLMATLAIRINEGRGSPRSFVALGAVLGAGYLAKSMFVIIALAVLVLLPWSTPRPRRRLAALTAFSFVAVAGPFVAAISLKTGRLTTGEAGRLNYLWMVSRQEPPFRHWQGEPPSYGVPLHPTRQIVSSPAVYEFAEPIPGTYAVWLDPSYWFEGARAPFSMTRQLDVVLEGLKTFAVLCGPLIAAVGALLWNRAGPVPVLRRLQPFWMLLLIALLGSFLYLLVLIEGRYVAPFISLGAILVAAAKLPEGEVSQDKLAAVTCGLLLAWMLLTVPSLMRGADMIRREWFGARLATVRPYRQAEQVKRLGLGDGDSIATVGDGFYHSWARLAKVRIVAELPTWEAPAFWLAGVSEQNQVYEALVRRGVRAVVTRDIPATASTAGWRAVENGQFYVRMLPHPAAADTTSVEP